MAEINENEVLYMLTIPRFNMPDFGSLDEDYLCREDQLTWYVSEDDLQIWTASMWTANLRRGISG